ncbi:DDB1- and CUL4-associated factor 11 isoform X2 [Pseudomyrmex gracilis]|uniref:DDB1- and CUL4-associated factor 11 isoform X2 n=1 Tax=Pseudomyrmex gracilis TaxID=219809 RepID=UPI0009958EE8|nr:DDB1- and CUL4-associated factor 11 isoform X2 [Pseudomyrmex gracilis]
MMVDFLSTYILIEDNIEDVFTHFVRRNEIRSRERRFPDTTRLRSNDISLTTELSSGMVSSSSQQNLSIVPLIQNRTIKYGFKNSEICRISNNLVPNTHKNLASYSGKLYCGIHSNDGRFFINATQDRWIRIYQTHNGEFNLYHEIQAVDVGWSILDIAISPDNRHLVYCSWSHNLYQYSISNDTHSIESLPLWPTVRRFSSFSAAFTNDSREIITGGNDCFIYVYDREVNQRVLRFRGHVLDVNAIAFADNSSQVFYSGSDDSMCKIWDRRILSENHPTPVGMFLGHKDGITYIDSRNDSRYLITNSKDQSIKLWDVRAVCDPGLSQNAIPTIPRDPNWDYRWQAPRLLDSTQLEGDTSVMTYHGHCVLRTLIRCRFSPLATTGQRYIYTGDARGRVIIYDVLTGKIVRNLKHHLTCTRDVSWHPYQHNIITSSWDSHAGMYEYRNIDEVETQTAGTNSNPVTDDANPLADPDPNEEI